MKNQKAYLRFIIIIILFTTKKFFSTKFEDCSQFLFVEWSVITEKVILINMFEIIKLLARKQKENYLLK